MTTTEEIRKTSLSDIQDMLYTEYLKNGYASMWSTTAKNQPIFDIAELGLICTEVSEAIEEVRKTKNETNLMIECADIIIRTLNFMTRKGYNASIFIFNKHEKNLTRGKLHGKQV